MTAPALLTVQIGIDPAHEDDLNRWYDQEHVPERLAMPGFLAARRYRMHDGSPNYLAVYELADPYAATSPEYMSQQPSEWMRRLRPHWRSLQRAVWVPLPAPEDSRP